MKKTCFELSPYHLNVILPVLCVIPLIYLIYITASLSVNIPIFDEWYYIPMFEKMFTGTLTFSDLWIPVNEHRLFIPKLVMLLSVKFTHWNLHYLVALNVVLVFFIFIFFLRFLIRERNKVSEKYIFLCLPAISLMIFSLVQYENLLWGVQNLIFINQLGVLIGYYFATLDEFSLKHLTFVFIGGLFCTFSHLAGLLFWPIVFMLLVFNIKIKTIRKKEYLLVWLAVSVLLYVAYFINYFFVFDHAASKPDISFKNSWHIFQFAMAVLGSPLALFDKNVAGLIGFGGFISFCIFFFVHYRTQSKTNFSLFLLAIALYGILSSILTAFGRISYEPSFVASRYSSFPILFWVALIILIMSVLSVKKKHNFSIKTGGVALLIFICLLSFFGSIQGAMLAKQRSRIMKESLNGFLSEPYPQNVNKLSAIYPKFKTENGEYIVHLPHVIQKLDILSRYQLSFFNDHY